MHGLKNNKKYVIHESEFYFSINMVILSTSQRVTTAVSSNKISKMIDLVSEPRNFPLFTSSESAETVL